MDSEYGFRIMMKFASGYESAKELADHLTAALARVEGESIRMYSIVDSTIGDLCLQGVTITLSGAT
jgi:hypothetical protein